jgi:hypothetical protein
MLAISIAQGIVVQARHRCPEVKVERSPQSEDERP